MSNLKIIDGKPINLGLVKDFEVFYHDNIKGGDCYKIKFIYSFYYEGKVRHSKEVAFGQVCYKTKELAEKRIVEIFEKQNNKEYII